VLNKELLTYFVEETHFFTSRECLVVCIFGRICLCVCLSVCKWCSNV